MCIDLEGHHSDGSSFVNVNDFCYYRNCLYNHRYKFSYEKEQVNESQYIVSCPGLGSDPPFRLDRGSGCDTYIVTVNLLLVEHKIVYIMVSLGIFVVDTIPLDNYSQLELSL